MAGISKRVFSTNGTVTASVIPAVNVVSIQSRVAQTQGDGVTPLPGASIFEGMVSPGGTSFLAPVEAASSDVFIVDVVLENRGEMPAGATLTVTTPERLKPLGVRVVPEGEVPGGMVETVSPLGLKGG